MPVGPVTVGRPRSETATSAPAVLLEMLTVRVASTAPFADGRGGTAAAYDAWKASLNGKPSPVIDGLSGDQRFFLAYAQSHRGKLRDAALRARVATDGHAPGPWRVLTVRNIDAWYPAFGVRPGDKLYLAPGKRITVWGS